MKFFKDEEAVSPVIGVILMVAITVILAAVIAAFVFGLGSGVSKTKNVGVTIRQVSDVACEMTLQGGADFDSVSNISADCGSGAAVSTDNPPVGEIVTTVCTTAKDHCIAVATFDDGSQQVVLDTDV